MRGIVAELKLQAAILLGLVGLMWALELADQVVLGRALDVYGIRPRDPSGLWGILFAPLLHAGFGHLIANTGPFLALGWLIMLRAIRDFFAVTLVALLVGGLGVWLFAAPNTVHIGASGLIFGYLGYLLLRGTFERSAASIVLAVIVGVLYGGALWGLLPGGPGVSWEGHAFGFAGGGVAARLLARPRTRRTGRLPARAGA